MRDWIGIQVDRYLNEIDRQAEERAPYESDLDLFFANEFNKEVERLISEAKADGDYEFWLASGDTPESILQDMQEEVIANSWQYQRMRDECGVDMDWVFDNYL